jgi:hypothetical protein
MGVASAHGLARTCLRQTPGLIGAWRAGMLPRLKGSLIQVGSAQARRIWLHAQRLDSTAPFGAGPAATPAAIAHLGYLQIDTIYVIERSHHHILHTRIPSYRREHLHRAQSIDKTIFEYWTHALSYLPTRPQDRPAAAETAGATLELAGAGRVSRS